MQTWYNGTTWPQRLLLFVLSIGALISGMRMYDPIGYALCLPLLLLIYLQLGVKKKACL